MILKKIAFLEIYLSIFIVQAIADVKIIKGEDQLIGINKTLNLSRAIDTSKALLLYSYSSNDSAPQNTFVLGRFKDASSIEFSRVGQGTGIYISWQVLEFTGNVRVQRGFIKNTIARFPLDIPIQSVNLNNAFPLVQIQSENLVRGASEGVTAELTSTNNLHLQADNSPPAKFSLAWQVIEYGGCEVQKILGNLAALEKTNSTSIPIPVDPSSSLIIGNYRQDGDDLNMDGAMSLLTNPNGTHIDYFRSNTSLITLSFVHYVVHFTDGTQVAHGQPTLSQNSYSYSDSYSGDSNRTVLILPGNFGREGEVLSTTSQQSLSKSIGEGWFEYSLLGDSLFIQRDAATNEAIAPFQLVTFAAKPYLNNQSGDTLVMESKLVNLTVNSHASALTYQWYRNGVPINGATITNYTFTATLFDNGAIYMCKYTNGTDADSSRNIKVTVKTITPSMPHVISRLDSNSTTNIFSDTLRIGLRSTPLDSANKIYYTLDGSEPLIGLQKAPTAFLYSDSITITQSKTLKAYALRYGLKSLMLTRTFTYNNLGTPIATTQPSAQNQNFADILTISLTASGPAGTLIIYYTTDGREPTASDNKYRDPFTITQTTTIKAIAIAPGFGISAVLTQTFSKLPTLQDSTFTLTPNKSLSLPSGYSISNPVNSNNNITIKILSPESLPISGFINISLGLNLSATGLFPKITLGDTVNGRQNLYQLKNGKVWFIGKAPSVLVFEVGSYFWAEDIQPPTIHLRQEKIGVNDSTQVLFSLYDNVQNLSYDLLRSDNANLNQSNIAVTDTSLRFHLKNSSAEPKILTLQLRLDDGSQKSCFPAKCVETFPLSQKFPAQLSPAIFKLGQDTSKPWDFIGLPINDPDLTFGKLAKIQNGFFLKAATWNNVSKKYVYLQDTDTLSPGKAVWMASSTSTQNLQLPILKASPFDSTGTLHLHLQNGWNQIANPHLEKRYWPMTWNNPERPFSKLKGLYSFNPKNGFFIPSDTLAPWRGYYVEYKGQDTIIDLSSQPVISGLPKKNTTHTNTFASLKFQLLQNGSAGTFLEIGAGDSFRNDMGVEDEMALPTLTHTPAFFALRQKFALSVDLIAFQKNTLMTWGLVYKANASNPDIIASENIQLNLLDKILPEHYEAWAISLTRHIKFPLGEGVSLPMSNLDDTLAIMIGTADQLKKYSVWNVLPETPLIIKLKLVQEGGRLAINLALPQAAKVEYSLWTLLGKRVFQQPRTGLNSGNFHFILPVKTLKPDFLGPLILSMRVNGEHFHHTFTQKIMLY